MAPDTFNATLKILHLEDSAVDHELACLALKRGHLTPFEIQRVETLHQFKDALQNEPDVIIADYQLPGFTALDAWTAVSPGPSRRAPPFILLSGAIGETAAVEAIQLGISDYVLKDNMGKLAHTIQRALEISRARAEKERADEELAHSLQRLAELTEHIQTTVEEERAAIAREIHDDIGGALTAVKFDLAWLQRRTQDATEMAHIQAATEMLQHALGASQRIMQNLRPPILDQGLPAALQWLQQSFSRRTGIDTQFQDRGCHRPLAPEILLVAYRVVQEALTNITKHAQCNKVWLEASDTDNTLTVEIRDNGRGMSADDQAKGKSFGLKGLRERARMVGGWLDVSSKPGFGTSVTLMIPLEPNTTPASAGCSKKGSI